MPKSLVVISTTNPYSSFLHSIFAVEMLLGFIVTFLNNVTFKVRLCNSIIKITTCIILHLTNGKFQKPYISIIDEDPNYQNLFDTLLVEF